MSGALYARLNHDRSEETKVGDNKLVAAGPGRPPVVYIGENRPNPFLEGDAHVVRHEI